MLADRALQLHRNGQLEAAEAAYREAIAAQPENLKLRHFHAGLLMQMGRLEQAVAALSHVVERQPDASPSRAALALCLRDLGRHSLARPHAVQAAADLPKDPLAALVAGSVLYALGECEAAVPHLQRCVAIEPAMSEGWYALGVALQQEGRWEEAERAHRRVALAQPAGWFNVGLCAERRGALDIAVASFEKAVAAMPGRVAPLVRLAQAQALSCDFAGEAATVTRIGRRMDEDRALALDDVPEAFVMTFLPVPQDTGRALLAHYSSVVQRRAGQAEARRVPTVAGERGGRRLRVGYVSPDFGEHAVGTLIAPVLQAHDRDRFEVTAYSLRRHGGPTAEAIRSGCEHVRECDALDPQQLASVISSDGIDVLVDLAGYTHGARPEALALRPAPLQLGYLGFIHPQAAPWLDATVLDKWVLPEGGEEGFGEPVRRLETLMLPGLKLVPEGPAERARFGLPEDAVLLAAFNNTYKFDAALLDAWLQVTSLAPQAVVVLSAPSEAQRRLTAYWVANGGRERQLQFLPRLSPAVHAARLACCDLFIDAFRYQGGASGVAAVASGLPIIAVRGDLPMRRMGAGLSSFLGLEDLACTDVASYIDTIVGLVRDPEARRHCRGKLVRGVDETAFLAPGRLASALERVYVERGQ